MPSNTASQPCTRAQLQQRPLLTHACCSPACLSACTRACLRATAACHHRPHQLVTSLESELAQLQADRDGFVAAFSEGEFDDLVSRWQGKLARARGRAAVGSLHGSAACGVSTCRLAADMQHSTGGRSREWCTRGLGACGRVWVLLSASALAHCSCSWV